MVTAMLCNSSQRKQDNNKHETAIATWNMQQMFILQQHQYPYFQQLRSPAEVHFFFLFFFNSSVCLEKNYKEKEAGVLDLQSEKRTSVTFSRLLCNTSHDSTMRCFMKYLSWGVSCVQEKQYSCCFKHHAKLHVQNEYIYHNIQEKYTHKISY